MYRAPVPENYETTISALEDPPKTATRLPQSQFHQEWPRHSSQPASHRTEALNSRLTGMGMSEGLPPEPPFAPQQRDGRLASKQTSRQLRLGADKRLKEGRDFARIRQDGQRLAHGCLIANWCRLPLNRTSRLGVITSSKIGNAVVRSRARRLLREVFRLHQFDFKQPLELVLVARGSLVGKGLAEVEKDFLTTFKKAGLLK